MFQPTEIVTSVADSTEVMRLPKGCIVGDLCGGRTFNDNIAAALERRSNSGWREVPDGTQQWTLIRIEH